MSLQLVGRAEQNAFYAAQAERYGAPVLLCGAADGSLALALGSRGYPVTAVEPSASLFEQAHRRKRASHVQLLHADLRSLRLPERYPLVIAPRNALGLASTLDDLDAMLEAVRTHLRPTGAFAFDVNLTTRSSVEGALGRPLFAPHLRTRGNALRRLRRSPLTAPDLDAALAAAGFEPRERYSDFDGTPFDEPDELQVVVAGLA